MAVNLLAALDDERYGASALARAHDAAARAGYTLRRVDGPDDAARRVDRPALRAVVVVVRSGRRERVGRASATARSRDSRRSARAACGSRGCARWRDRADAGIFGPYGVAEAHRGSGIGEALLTAALCGLRAAGYAFALIPAVSGERLIATYVRRTGACGRRRVRRTTSGGFARRSSRRARARTRAACSSACATGGCRSTCAR